MGAPATMPPLRTPTAADRSSDEHSDLILPDLSLRSDFRMFTASLELTDQQTAAGAPILHAIGSSTVQDLQGDTMVLTALQDMTESPIGLAIFLNHSYTVPEDVAGHLCAAPTIVVQNGIGDLHLDIAINTNNPRAMDAYKAIQGGTRLGISIGCMIREAIWQNADGSPVDQDNISFWDVIEGKVVLQILHVQTLEFSIVGIPANQRSWVQYAAQGLFQRSLLDGAPDLRLAPLVRAWFPKEFERLARSIDDQPLSKQLLDIAPRRGGSGSNILWKPAEKSFALATSGGRTQALTREKLASLLHAPAEAHRLVAASVAESMQLAPVDAPVVETPVVEAAPVADPETEKSATGKSDWPLGERDRAWDNDEAHARLLEWAGGKDNLDVAKFRSVHFWSPDGEEKSDVSKFKLAFCDVVGGTVKAMPRGIFACAGSHGVDAADIPEADKTKVKTKIEAYYKRMADAFDDPSIVAPWAADEGKEKSTDAADAEKSQESQEKSQDRTISGTGGDLVVKADGTHGAYTGSHSHAHSAFGEQGGDDNHEHEHSHDGDADHHHAHDKAADGVEHVGHVGVELVADGIERTVTLSAAPEAASEATPEAVPEMDPQRAAMLKMFSDMVAPHGFVVLEAAAVSAHDPLQPIAQRAWSDDQEQGIRAGIAAIDAQVDSLMRLTGIPDDDDWGGGSDDGDGDDDGDRQKRVAALITRTLGLGLALKEGKRHSEADMEQLQAIHDACKSLTDGACCMKSDSGAANANPPADDPAAGADANSDTGNHPTAGGGGSSMDDARDMASTGKTLAALSGVAIQLEALTNAFGGLDVKALEGQVQEAQARLTEVLATTKAAENRLAAVERQHEALAAAADAAQTQLERLTNIPLGRPTTFAARRAISAGVRGDSAASDADGGAGIASYADLMAANGTDAWADRQMPRDAQGRALAQTTVEHVAGIGDCRRWPAGVGKGARPPLSSEQRVALGRLPDAVGNLLRYQEGGEALIPIVNDGE